MGSTLSQEQTSFAEKMEQFVKKMEMLVLNTFAHLNGSKDLQIRDFLYEEADYTIQVSRGPVIEKGGFEVCKVKKELPPMIPEPIWNRYLQIDIYPKTLWWGCSILPCISPTKQTEETWWVVSWT